MAASDSKGSDHLCLPSGPSAHSGPRVPTPPLTADQMKRYSRQVILDDVGAKGQRKLLDSRVLLIGAGGLGSPSAIYLAAAGVGTIGLVDGDRVDITNLHRQVLHFNHDVGRPKTQSARRHLEDINPDVKVVQHQVILTSGNAQKIIGQYDLVLNGSDNFPTRYLVNDACVMLGKPLIDASILKWEGQATVFLPGRGCYRCLFPEPPPPGIVPTCAEGGIIGALAGHLGTLQAIEAVKVLLNIGESLANRMLVYDALTAEYRTFRWRRNRKCTVCGDNPTIKELVDYEEFCGVPLPDRGDGRSAYTPSLPGSTSADERNDTDDSGGEDSWEIDPVAAARYLYDPSIQWVDVREPWEYFQGHIPNVIHIPMGQINARLSEIDRDKRAILVCAVGRRSGLVVSMLRDAGYDKVYNLEGGMTAWEKFGLPTEQHR